MTVAPDLTARSTARPPWTAGERLIGLALALSIVVSDGCRFLAGKAQLAFFDDDFFYYLQIARSLAQGHGSTFDGTHLTNGYHPLWMSILWTICRLPQASWLPIVTLLCAAGAWLCFLLARRIFRLAPCDPLLATTTAAMLGFATMFLNRGGMEITLTLPLIFLPVYLRLTGRLSLDGSAAMVYGLFGALIILSRLDAILFIGPLFVAELGQLVLHRRAVPFAAALRLLVGLLPIPLYLLSNLYWFGTLLTVSSQAKQLEHHPAFSFDVIVYMFRYLPGGVRTVVLAPACVLLLFAAFKLVRRGTHVAPVALCLMAFPLIHAAALASLSDWPIWQWYLYSWVAGTLGALIVIFQPEPAGPHPQLRLPGIAACGILFAMLAATTVQRVLLAHRRTGLPFAIYDAAVQLTAFAQDHPGIYAMGDRAGTPGYMIHQPLLQLEGLVMDEAYLDRIRRQQDLRQVLDDYHVRYYVGSDLIQRDGCYLAVEPAQGGSHSPKLRGRFCQKPVAVWTYAGLETELFDLGPSTNP